MSNQEYSNKLTAIVIQHGVGFILQILSASISAQSPTPDEETGKWQFSYSFSLT